MIEVLRVAWEGGREGRERGGGNNVIFFKKTISVKKKSISGGRERQL